MDDALKSSITYVMFLQWIELITFRSNLKRDLQIFGLLVGGSWSSVHTSLRRWRICSSNWTVSKNGNTIPARFSAIPYIFAWFFPPVWKQEQLLGFVSLRERTKRLRWPWPHKKKLKTVRLPYTIYWSWEYNIKFQEEEFRGISTR